MKSLIVSTTLLLLANAAFSDNVPVRQSLTIFSDVTDAGLEVHVVEMPRTPVVAVRVYVRGGAFGEAENRGCGLARAVQAVICDSLEQRRRDISTLNAEPRLGCGADFKSETMYDAICFSTCTPKQYFVPALRELATVICRETFDAAAWLRVRDRLNRELMRDQTDAREQLDNLYRRTAYAWNPVRYPVRGEHSLFPSLRRDDLINYYKKYFVADNVIVVVAGDVNPVEVVREVSRAFANLPRRTAGLPSDYRNPVQTAPRRLERHADVTQSYVRVGVTTVEDGHPDGAVIEVLARLLAREKEHINTLLAERVKNVRDVNIALFSAPRNPGALVVSFVGDPDTAARGARVLQDWLLTLPKKTWDEDIVSGEAKLMLTEFLDRMNAPEHLACLVGSSALRLGNPNYPAMRVERWQEVTPERLQAVCARHFRPERLNTAILSPKARADEHGGLPTENILRDERHLLGATRYPARRVVLNNGVVLILRRNPHDPVVRFLFACIGGVWCEHDYNNGVFSLLGELMCSGSAERSLADFRRRCRDTGLALRVDVKEQIFTLSGVCAPAYAADAARLLCDAWTAPRIDKKTLARAVASVIARIHAQPTNTVASADLILRASLFFRQPYRLNTLGSLDSVARTLPRDVANVHTDFITPRNTTIVVSGDFDESAMEMLFHKALKRFKEKRKTDDFIHQAHRFALSSAPPYITVKLPPEPAATGCVTRFFVSSNPGAMVLCGVPVPGYGPTNYPPGVARIVRGALLNRLETLRSKWTDYQDALVINLFDAAGFRGYEAGWVYAWIALPEQYVAEGAHRLRLLFHDVLSGLASGAAITSARRRADIEHQLALARPDKDLERIAVREMFGYAGRFPRSFQACLDTCGTNCFTSFYREYGKYPVTAIVTPER